jgi:hypothetical protein
MRESIVDAILKAIYLSHDNFLYSHTDKAMSYVPQHHNGIALFIVPFVIGWLR